jgi:hypothetical protein
LGKLQDWISGIFDPEIRKKNKILNRISSLKAKKNKQAGQEISRHLFSADAQTLVAATEALKDGWYPEANQKLIKLIDVVNGRKNQEGWTVDLIREIARYGIMAVAYSKKEKDINFLMGMTSKYLIGDLIGPILDGANPPGWEEKKQELEQKKLGHRTQVLKEHPYSKSIKKAKEYLLIQDLANNFHLGDITVSSRNLEILLRIDSTLNLGALFIDQKHFKVKTIYSQKSLTNTWPLGDVSIWESDFTDSICCPDFFQWITQNKDQFKGNFIETKDQNECWTKEYLNSFTGECYNTVVHDKKAWTIRIYPSLEKAEFIEKLYSDTTT